VVLVSVVLDARPVFKAAQAAFTARLGPWQAFDWNKVPGSTFGPEGVLPDQYGLLTVERRVNGAALRQSANIGLTGWRITAGAVGRTPDECRWVMDRAAQAFHEQTLTLLVSGADDAVTTPLQFETDRAPERDDEGRYFGSSSWTCSL
jgi:hypothetical protein